MAKLHSSMIIKQNKRPCKIMCLNARSHFSSSEQSSLEMTITVAKQLCIAPPLYRCLNAAAQGITRCWKANIYIYSKFCQLTLKCMNLASEVSFGNQKMWEDLLNFFMIELLGRPPWGLFLGACNFFQLFPHRSYILSKKQDMIITSEALKQGLGFQRSCEYFSRICTEIHMYVSRSSVAGTNYSCMNIVPAEIRLAK